MAQKMADKGYHGYTKTPTPPDEMLQKMGGFFRAQQEAEAARKPVSEMAQKMADKGFQGSTRTPAPPDEMLQKMGASFRTQQENEAARRLGVDISGISDPKIRQLQGNLLPLGP